MTQKAHSYHDLKGIIQSKYCVPDYTVLQFDACQPELLAENGKTGLNDSGIIVI